MLLVVVEFVDEYDIGVRALDGFGDVLCLLVVGGAQVGEQLAFGVAVEACVKGRHLEFYGLFGGGCGRLR